MTQPFQVLVGRNPGAAPIVGPVGGVPLGPADPGGIHAAGADIHVPAERNDRDIDVLGRLGGRLQLGQQVLAGRLQGRQLARAGHRTGIVEHQGHAQPRRSPGGDGGRADIDGRDAGKAEKGRLDGAGPGHRHGAATGVVALHGGGDRGVLHVGIREQGAEMRVRGRLDLRRRLAIALLRHRQRGGIERLLHVELGRLRDAHVEDAAGQNGDAEEGQREGRKQGSLSILEQTAKRCGDSHLASPGVRT
jgi:hypothetical protein